MFKLSLGVLCVAFVSVGSLAAAQPTCFEDKSKPERLEYFGLEDLRANPLTRAGGEFTVILDRNLNAMNLDMSPAGAQPLIELIKTTHYHVSRWRQFYTFRSVCHFWEDPNLLFADLLMILGSQNYAAACRFNDADAIDSQASIRRLWKREDKVTLLTCMYRPKAVLK